MGLAELRHCVRFRAALVTLALSLTGPQAMAQNAGPLTLQEPISPAKLAPPPLTPSAVVMKRLKRDDQFSLPALDPKYAEDFMPTGAAGTVTAPPSTPSTLSPLDALTQKSAPASPGPQQPTVAPLFTIPGTDRKLNVSWDDGGFRFRNSDGDFTLHLGGRLMTDEVWFNQSRALHAPAVQPPGSPLANVTGVGPGVGDLTDGAFVRRARFIADGTVFKMIDFKVEFDFENYNSLLFDESFIGIREVPYVGMVRFGQEHVPFGLEAYTSSRFLPMMERSPLFDAFYQEFAPGIFTNTTFFDQRLTTQHMFHRVDNFSQFNGASFGDGKYAYSGRISGLPWYEENGKYLLHLGLAYQWRKGSPPLDFNGGSTSQPNPTVTDNTDLIRFRARQSLRDAVGLQGDAARVVDTGNIIAQDVQGLNAELLWYRGPFWFQSEASLAHVDDAVFPATSASTFRGSLNFWGVYGMMGYFLTGENRGYDKPMGKYGRVVPKTNFFIVKDKTGAVQTGPGAWEVLYRYSYVDMSDKTVLGGMYGEHTVGVNWYWNTNIKMQFNYILGQRMVPQPAVSGIVQGFGIRGSLEF